MTGQYTDVNGKVWTVKTQLIYAPGTKNIKSQISTCAQPTAESYTENKSVDNGWSFGEPGGNKITTSYSATGDIGIMGHEPSHNWGLKDQCHEAVAVDDEGHVLSFKDKDGNKRNEFAKFLVTNKGYEGDPLGGWLKEDEYGNLVPETEGRFSQKTIDLLASAALSKSKELNSKNFVIGGAIDQFGYNSQVAIPYKKLPAEYQNRIYIPTTNATPQSPPTQQPGSTEH